MEKIIIINLGGLGDLLLSTPALRALRQAYPHTGFSMLISPGAAEMVEDFTCIDKFHIFCIAYRGYVSFTRKSLRDNFNTIFSGWNFGFLKFHTINLFKNLKVLLALRKKRFDLAVNMRTLTSRRSARKMRFLLAIIRPKKTAGRDTEGRGKFFDISIAESDLADRYERDYDIGLVEALGIEVKDKNIELKVDDESRARIAEFLEREGLGKEDILIGLHPGGMPSRRWPIEKFVKTIEILSQRIPCWFVVTGGKDEENLAEKLMGVKARIINTTGRLNFKELTALIERCRVYISNDTGPMHIAAILKTGLAAIFGPGDLKRYNPSVISAKAIVLYKSEDCSPCNKVNCYSKKCLEDITPEEIVEATLKLLRL